MVDSHITNLSENGKLSESALCKVPQDNAPFGRPEISERACRPLIREKDDDVRQEAIRQIVKTPKENRTAPGLSPPTGPSA